MIRGARQCLRDTLFYAFCTKSGGSCKGLYLGLMAKESGKRTLALTKVALLNDLDTTAASQLKFAIGTEEVQR